MNSRYGNMYVMYQCSLFAGRASLGTIATVTAVATATATSAAAAAAPTVESISLAMAFGIAACGLGQFLAGALGLPSINLAAMAVLASLFASVGSSLTASSATNAATPFKGDSFMQQHVRMGLLLLLLLLLLTAKLRAKVPQGEMLARAGLLAADSQLVIRHLQGQPSCSPTNAKRTTYRRQSRESACIRLYRLWSSWPAGFVFYTGSH